MPDQYPGRPTHPDFWVLSQVIRDQDKRAEGHAVPFEELISQVVDVHSVVYMASQRAMRARHLLSTGPIEARLMSLWLDAFMAGVAFAEKKNESPRRESNPEEHTHG